MKDLARVLSTYALLDASLEDRAVDGSVDDPDKLEAHQVMNDQSYFLLCWGQLENEINGTCREAIRRRRAAADWQQRRGWDLYNPEDPRLSGLSFLDRVRLVLDGQAGRGSPFAKVVAYYEMRNKIAHGRLQARRIDIRAMVQDLHLIQSALDRAL